MPRYLIHVPLIQGLHRRHQVGLDLFELSAAVGDPLVEAGHAAREPADTELAVPDSPGAADPPDPEPETTANSTAEAPAAGETKGRKKR